MEHGHAEVNSIHNTRHDNHLEERKLSHHLAQTSIGRLASAVKPAFQAPPPAAAGLTAADENGRTRRHQMKGKMAMKQ
jgi:hypothetical protein